MADEIPGQNVIRIYRDESRGGWVARIGPDDQAIERAGATPVIAVLNLMSALHNGHYAYDPTWRP